jgi:hypothetical protein
MVSQDARDQKRREYSPGSWSATKRSETRYVARNAGTGAEVHFTVAYGRVFTATGASGEYPIYGGACGCPDYENRAMDEARNCRHSAALCCVEDLIAKEREARERELATPNKYANRLSTLAATIDAAREAARLLVENELGKAA